MDSITSFFTAQLDVVFFFYGLAFFSMGLAIFLEMGRTSEFRLARAMGSLAGFGILHGFHEWMEMFQKWGKLESFSPEQLFFLDGIRVGSLVFSFLLLVTFGIRLIFSGQRNQNRDERVLALVTAGTLAIFWLASVVLTRIVYQPTREEFVLAADVLSRYITAIPGSMLAAWAIFLEQRAFEARGMREFGRSLRWAAIAILLYGVVGQFFVSNSILFPSSTINADLFLSWFGFPVQLFRALMAAMMAIFVIRALRAFELESQQRLAEANEARLAAQQTALETQKQARAESEQLNRELQTAVQDLTVLFELSRSLSATLDKETLLQTIIPQIFKNLPRITGALVMLRNKPEEPAELAASSGYPNRITNPSQCKFGQAYELGTFVANSGKIAFCDTVKIIPLGYPPEINFEHIDMKPVANAHTVGVPVMIQDVLMGSLVLSANPEAASLTGRDLFLISTIAGQLGIALENVRLYEEVQAREALRGEMLHQVVSAQEKERQRIARELHDGTGQTLTALGLGLAAAAENIQHNSHNLNNQLRELKSISAQALQEVHDVISDLRPSLLDNLGLVSALRSQVQSFEERMGINASLAIHGEKRRLESDLETVIFRIAQEALTNVAKHAQAQNVDVDLTIQPDLLKLVVTDDGQGFEPEEALSPHRKGRQAWGLLGMQERVTLVQGSCEIISQPNQGTTIVILVPLHGKEMDYVKDKADAG